MTREALADKGRRHVCSSRRLRFIRASARRDPLVRPYSCRAPINYCYEVMPAPAGMMLADHIHVSETLHMKRTLGIASVLALVIAGLVSFSTRPIGLHVDDSIAARGAARRAARGRGRSEQRGGGRGAAAGRGSDRRRRSSRRRRARRRSSRPLMAPSLAAVLVASFDGLGVGFEGPQGTPNVRNPSDNTLAVGPDHIVQIVNTRMAIFTKKGKKFDTTGRVLYGPVPTANVFKGFGGAVRGAQQRRRGRALRPARRSLADRDADLPARSRAARSAAGLEGRRAGRTSARSGMPGTAGSAAPLFQPPPPPPAPAGAARAARPRPGRRPRTGPAGPVLDVLRDQHERRSARLVLPLRVPAAALSRLSAAGGLARRLLRADEHRRRLHPEARLRRRSREDAQRRAGDRAVPRHRRRRTS